MEISYKYAESTQKPSALEVTPSTVYMRKDIESKTRTDETAGEERTIWTYQEAKLTPAEFNEYSSRIMAENAIKGTDDSEHITQIMAGQETGDANQLAIMEAIADLYEAVATIGA